MIAHVKLSTISKLIIFNVGEDTLTWGILHKVGGYLNWYKLNENNFYKKLDKFYVLLCCNFLLRYF